MAEVVFTVRSSSSPELYSLKAARTPDGVRFTCTCPAGGNGQSCKHRVALIVGDTSSVVDVDPSALAELHRMATGSPIVPAIDEVAAAEKAVAAAQKRLKAAKIALSRSMLG